MSDILGQTPADVRRAFLIGAAITLAFLSILPPGEFCEDGNSMLAVAESLVQGRGFAIEMNTAVPGRYGLRYSPWYLLQSLLFVPFVMVGYGLASVTHLPPHYLARACAMILPALMTGGTVAAIYLLALRVGSSREGAWRAGLSYAFGTIAMVYGRNLFAESLIACIVAWAVYGAVQDSRRAATWTAVACALAVLAKPPGILVGLVLSACLFRTGRRWNRVLAPALGAAVGLAIYGLYNYYRFESFFTFGQDTRKFQMSTIPGSFFGLLVSPGRGMLWYSPVVLLYFWAARRCPGLERRMAFGLFGAFLGIYSLWYWSDGWWWGPRYLLPAFPLLAAFAGTLESRGRRAALVGLSLLGFAISAPNLFSFHEYYCMEASKSGVSESALMWSPSDSPLTNAWPAGIRQVRGAMNSDVRALLSEAEDPQGGNQLFRVVAVWWWMLPAAGISRWVGVAVMLGMLAAAGVMMAKARSDSGPGGGEAMT